MRHAHSFRSDVARFRSGARCGCRGDDDDDDGGADDEDDIIIKEISRTMTVFICGQSPKL